ncbi:GNAT superfamily N-acetyltransferase [Bradyrhizobium japonicum]
MPDIVVTDVIASSMVQAIERRNDDFGGVITAVGNTRPIAVVLQDSQTKRALGGAIGLSSAGLLFLDSFFLPRQLRGRGLGNAILKTFEEEGRQRGCRSAFLYTVTFPDFYTRNGWKASGRTPCDPPGAFRVFMIKSLEARS